MSAFSEWDLIVVGAGPAGTVDRARRASTPTRGSGCCCSTGPTSRGTSPAATASPPTSSTAGPDRGDGRRGRLDAADPARARPRRLVGGAADGPPGLRHPARGLRRPAGRARGRRRAPPWSGTGSPTSRHRRRVVLDGRFRAPRRGRRRRRAPRPARPPRPARRRARALAIRGYAPTPPDRPGHPGDPLRRPPPAVVRLGLRPRRRAVQRRLRRAAARTTGRDPPTRALLLDQLERLLPGSVEPAEQWKGHHLPLSGWRWDQPDGRVLLDRRRGRADQPDDRRGHLLRRRDRHHGRPRDRAGVPGRVTRHAGALHRRAVRALLGRHLKHTWTAARLSRSARCRRGRHPGRAAGTGGSSTSWSSSGSATAASRGGWSADLVGGVARRTVQRSPAAG